MGCPRCRFPATPGQPQTSIHTGTTRHETGATDDVFETFHKTCGTAHLIEKGRAKVAALLAAGSRTTARTTERKAS
jgi:hypothetical protein